MEKIIKSEKFKGVILWRGEFPPNRMIDVKKTDDNIKEYLENRMAQWLLDNPEDEESNDYLDWKEIAAQEHWLELGRELLNEDSIVLAWEDTEEGYVKKLIKDAELYGLVDFQLIKLDDEKIMVKFFNGNRCVYLPRDNAHKILEDCILSKNRYNYFWQLGYQELESIGAGL